MNWWQKIRSRVRALFRKQKLDTAMSEEMHFHIDQQTRQNLEAGMSPVEARQAALREFGPVERIKETCREERGVIWLEGVFQDVRFALRQLRKNPGFAAMAMAMLALGIGANTAIFSVVNGVLLKPLPYRAPEQLVRVFESSPGQPKFAVSPDTFQNCREQNSSLAGMAVYTREDLDLSRDNRPERLAALRVTSGFFEVLGAQPLLGREFRREDEAPGNHRVVILSHGLWQRRFNADPDVVGKAVTLSGQLFTVVGVMPPGVQHVGGDYRSMPHGETVDAWWPVTLRPQAEKGWHYFNVIGRLKPGVPQAQAAADFKLIGDRLARQFPDGGQGWHLALAPLQEEIVGGSRTTLWVVFGAVLLVLLIACANVANLLLTRSVGREREIAVRASVGAGRGRIARQLLTESLVLAAAGAAAGILLAKWAVAALRAFGPDQLPRLQAVRLDGRILFFTLGLTVLTGILFGLMPAWQAGKLNLNGLLKEGGRGGAGRRQRRLRDTLVAAEVALALLLLVGTGLLLRSFWQLRQTDPGFNPEHVLTASLLFPDARYGDETNLTAFQQRLLARITELPGVQSAGLTSDLPWTGYDENAGFTIEGKTFPPNDGPGGRYHRVSADYFRAVGVPLLAGRFFNAEDRRGTRPVVLINHSLAERYWPGENAVGRRFTFSDQPKEQDWFTIVGIVGDVKDFPTSSTAVPAFYWSTDQMASREVILAVRTSAEPAGMIEVLRQEVGGLDKDLPLAGLKTLKTVTSTAVAGRRFTLWLISGFALTALALAAIGIYSVISYVVAQRTHEIGVRMALGAQARDVTRMTLKQGMRPALTGVALGLAGAFALTRLMSSLLFGVSATDPETFAASALLLTIAALVPCWLPARRAARVDPMIALRND